MQRQKSTLANRYPATKQLPLQMSSYGAISPQKLTKDYLRAVHRHVENMLHRNVISAVLRRTQREYVITVPAVWKETARDLTARCAVDAGMGIKDDIHIVSEPEAAAMYAIPAFKEINGGVLEKGDTFVLCDAGGGYSSGPLFDLNVYIDQRLDRTVDLISYTVKTLDPILELEEAAPGSGSACGSVFLNRIFEENLNNRFKNDHKWGSDPQILEEAMDHFENQTKVRFNGIKGDNIPMFGLGPQPGIKRDRLELSSTDIKEIFEPVISEILGLIEDQIQQTAKKVKLILLVGGFGESRYLQTRIKERFGAGIEVKVSRNRFVPSYQKLKKEFFERADGQRKPNGSRPRSSDERLGRGQGTHDEAPTYKGKKSSETLRNRMCHTI